MKYDYCSKLSSPLPAQTTINHCFNGLIHLMQRLMVSQQEDHTPRRPASKRSFFSSINNEIRILVVDDNKEMRNLLDSLFKQCGFIVVIANNGLDALGKFNDERLFHMVLTDICMPGINGNILSKQIKKTSANIPVIAITASPELAGNYFDEILTKPFDLESLLETVQNLLSGSARSQSLKELGKLREIISTRKSK